MASLRPLHDRSATTCVIADDHPPIIDCLSRYLTGAGFKVVATAPGVRAALVQILAHRPRVCIADVRMPHLDGLELARRAAIEAPETAVLLYSGIFARGLAACA